MYATILATKSDKTLQLRNGKSYVEFSGKEDLDTQTLAAFDPEVFTISDSCPALETLLQQAVERESQAPDDPIEAFDETAMSSAPDLPATHNVNKKRPFVEKTEAAHNGHRHRKRSKKRARLIGSEGHLHGRNAPAIQTCIAVPSNVDAFTLPAATGGYIGKDLTVERGAVRDVEWFRSQPGWTYLKWDGSRALSIVDKAQRLIVVGLKKIQDKMYDDDVEKVAELLERARSTKMTLGPADTNHLCGEGFPAAACGWSMGQGQKQPMHTGGKYAGVMQELIAEPCIQRVASVQDAGFACWSFKNYKYYLDAMKKLGASVERFEPNFERSQFASITFNFGPQVCTCEHTNAKNCPHSMCAITAAGKFDHTKGGHLVLPDLKVIIEFPSGCTLLLPSAILRHHNTPIQPGETRYSVTQYSAGGIFRWLEYGNRTEVELRAQDPACIQEVYAERKGRWAKMVNMFVTLDEVRQYHSAV
ncbi:hypothetical protein E1B28_010552 [Marasmius oreades]|uniref:Uncharacterized protein n=1 Tax=Marasmius oreades TaxID=181124 RepID=A0A9P7RXZ6_9AGAR|nr:uncharacterized protein E1B28_010552 [Marasmius oreades]KAG7091523.1 hypothetical protein E1B28_010552 [Marasmius oreades]